MFYTMFYAGIETIFFFMKYLYVPDFGEIMTFSKQYFVMLLTQEQIIDFSRLQML